MNYWTEQSAEFAQQRNYLDELFKVYPLNLNLRKESAYDCKHLSGTTPLGYDVDPETHK